MLGNLLSLTFVLILILATGPLRAQFEEDYIPRDSYNRESRDLIMAIDDRYEIHISYMNIHDPVQQDKYYKITEELKKAIRDGKFVRDDSLEFLVNSIYNKIIDNNRLKCIPGKILVLRSPIVNAFCYSEGTIILTTALLAAYDTEDELASTIAHELAHYERKHAMVIGREWTNSGVGEVTGRALKHSLEGSITIKEFERTTALLYGLTRFNREAEIDADVLGLLFMDQAGYNVKGVLSGLDKLDSGTLVNGSIGIDLFKPLDTPRYPFIDAWLTERAGIYRKDQSMFLFFKTDSLGTHPEIEDRKSRLMKNFDSLINNDTRPIKPYSKSIKYISMFESAKGAYINKEFDYCLYYSLVLKNIFPRNKYLSTLIASVLIDTHDALKSGREDDFVPRMTIDYTPDLVLVNNLLHNLKDGELLDLAFHFLSYSTNFDKENQNHYYLLHKICLLSHRNEVAKKIAESYLEKFPDGEFVKSMRDR